MQHRRASRGVSAVVVVASAWLAVQHASAAELPVGFAETRIAQGLDPTALAIAPDGRLFLAEKNGSLRIIKDDVLLSAPFARLSVDNTGEQGLLGVALDPAFASNGFVYVVYTAPGTPARNRVSRLTAEGDIARAGSEITLYDLSVRSSVYHNGGGIGFGLDGKLYVSAGDDRSGTNAQSDNTLHGKILRLNPDGTVPIDNPDTWLPAPYNAIWARGLRNPFSLAFQPGTGALFINDVGENTFEEIDRGAEGANYGWPAVEGELRDKPSPDPERYRDPVHVYQHDGTSCSITGGAFYNPTTVSFPSDYTGQYFFADYCGNYIKRLDPATDTVTTFATAIRHPLNIVVAPDGTLYYTARGGSADGSEADNRASSNGELYRVRFSNATGPSISVQPEDQRVGLGQAATFAVAVSGSGPLSYQWFRDDAAISGATSSTLVVVATDADDGAAYFVRVSNAGGAVDSEPALLRVSAENSAPVLTIVTPSAGTSYRAGELLSFSGTATDAEDGPLPSSALTWAIELHHDTHAHPALAAVSGRASGTYEVPRTVETSANVFYRIVFSATDSAGRTTTRTRDIVPETATFTLETEPAGLALLLDGQPVATPVTVTGVVGVTRSLEAAASQTRAGRTLAFVGWSDGAVRSHDFDTAAEPVTYRALYAPVEEQGGLRASYYADRELTGTPVLTRTEVPDFDWGVAAPDDQLPIDGFSARWTGELIAPETDSYVFRTVSDDGVRLWIDGQLVIDNWTNHASTSDQTAPIALVAGQSYAIRLEYYEASQLAELHLRWSYGAVSGAIPASTLRPASAGGLRGDYYAGFTLSGTPAATRVEAVDFGWGLESPLPGVVPSDYFSVRWSGELEAPVSGSYVFSTVSDDAVRLYIDDTVVIDNRNAHASTVDSAPARDLIAGQRYKVRLEYYEVIKAAEIRLRWSYPGVSTSAIPATVLSAPAP